MRTLLRSFASSVQSSPPRETDAAQDSVDFEDGAVLVGAIDAVPDTDDVISLAENDDATETAHQRHPSNHPSEMSRQPEDPNECSRQHGYMKGVSHAITPAARPVRRLPMALLYGPNPNHGTSSSCLTHSIPGHQYQPTRFHPTASRTIDNHHQDLRSQAHAGHRAVALNVKYFSFRAIKRGQLNMPHHQVDVDWYSRPIALESLPADCRIVVMDRRLLFEEAQKWPKPPRHHRKESQYFRHYVTSAVHARKKYMKGQLDSLTEEARYLMEDMDEWDRNDETAMQRWDTIDDENFREQLLSEACSESLMQRHIFPGGDECRSCQWSEAGLCDWCVKNDAEKVARHFGADGEWSIAGEHSDELQISGTRAAGTTAGD